MATAKKTKALTASILERQKEISKNAPKPRVMKPVIPAKSITEPVIEEKLPSIKEARNKKVVSAPVVKLDPSAPGFTSFGMSQHSKGRYKSQSFKKVR